jgi:hypothetical protein
MDQVTCGGMAQSLGTAAIPGREDGAVELFSRSRPNDGNEGDDMKIVRALAASQFNNQRQSSIFLQNRRLLAAAGYDHHLVMMC